MNRLSDSERDAMTASPRCTSSRQSGGRRLAFDDGRQAAGDRLDRRERVVHLVADDADQALPRLPLFFAQRLAQVGQDQQLVRPAALAELAAPDLPAADAAGERRVDDARRFAGQAIGEVELGRRRRPSSRSAGWLEEPRAGAVDELQLVLFVEGEHRDVDLGHHLAQQRRRLERVEALVAERLDERVDFDHDLAERIAAARAAGADREVAFAERGEQVRQRLERQDDALAQREREAEAEGDDEDGQRPLDLGRVVAGPEKDERDERARAAPRRSAINRMRRSWLRRLTGGSGSGLRAEAELRGSCKVVIPPEP